MQRTSLYRATAFVMSTAASLSSFADSDSVIEEVLIIGSQSDAYSLAGSGAIIGGEQITIEAATDINQLLKTVPGVYVHEEDGYGLRPNFGIRGATSERSEKVTLLEDGVLIAPAPYSNPAAYYFPTAMRMSGVEILKGAPLLRYGPQTTGGVINMASTALPDDNSGSMTLIAGENSTYDVMANYGGRVNNFSWLVETVQRNSDGFKDIDRSHQDTGFDIEDYLIKLGWEGESQSLLFKAQHSEETSNETYLGLTDADFNRDENRRYGLSEIDEMDNDHDGYSLTHKLHINDSLALTSTAYYNEFSRDWFKLSGGGDIIADANMGDDTAQGVLDGTIDAFGLKYKHNSRDYTSKGIQTELNIDLASHNIHTGVRFHKDEMDRYQPEDFYNQINGELIYDYTKDPSGSNNRKEEADAFSFWAIDSWQATDVLNINLALRYEDVDTQRKEYVNSDRSDAPSRRSNSTQEWLPGASLTYDFSDSWQALVGVHRGFSPLGFSPLGGGAKENEDPETSINYEAGVRYNYDNWFVEAIGFYSDFENKAENCSNGNPCSNGDTSGSFVTGDAVIAGVEFQLSTQFELNNLTIPLDIAYTYTDAYISEDNAAEGFEDGDDLAAIPENTYSVRTGIESQMGWDNYLIAKYTDEICVDIGCNRDDSTYAKTESLFTMDFISRYALTNNSTLFLKVENFLDQQEIISRTPDGARPNKGRTASIGYAMNF